MKLHSAVAALLLVCRPLSARADNPPPTPAATPTQDPYALSYLIYQWKEDQQAYNDAAFAAAKNIQILQDLQRKGNTVLPPEMRPTYQMPPQPR